MATESTKGAGGAPPSDTVTCTINDVQVEVPKGTRIIEAAEAMGVGIAHYCYHPGLSAPAMCRMCLVEVEGAPKLAPACVTEVADGQVIHTESPKALEARRGTLEFYLLNHPLDCPVCDKSGECKLQDYVHQEGRRHGRSIEAKRVLGQDDFGGDILYDGDRCIMCTRCVRFMREVAGDDRLCVVQRGSRSVIDTFFEDGLEGSPWAGNIVDICPVGALLSKDFLHKARVWDLDRTSTICPNCSQGCNIKADTRDNTIVRLRPRVNPDVNAYWMCDYGRYRYEWLNRSETRYANIDFPVTEAGDGRSPVRPAGASADADIVAPARIEAPLVRTEEGSLSATTWQNAIRQLVERMRAADGIPVLVIGSPFLGNEDNALASRLGALAGAAPALRFRSPRTEDEVPCPGVPRLARRRDLAANVRGLEALGYKRTGDDDGRGGLEAPSGAVIIAAGDALPDVPASFGADAALFIVIGHTLSAAGHNAHFALPATTFIEQEGTFTNHEGRVQRFWPALRPPPLARPVWQICGVVLAGLGDGPAPADAGSAFVRTGQLFDAFAGLSYATLGARGALLNEPVRLTGGAA
jgi:NADH-quinone oxidoreductase subunit G